MKDGFTRAWSSAWQLGHNEVSAELTSPAGSGFYVYPGFGL